MSTSSGLELSGSISRSEYLSSLPLWRRWLSTLNWRPVVDYELRAIEFERRRIAHEKRMRRYDELDAKMAALWPSSSSSSTQGPSAASDLPT